MRDDADERPGGGERCLDPGAGLGRDEGGEEVERMGLAGRPVESEKGRRDGCPDGEEMREVLGCLVCCLL